MNDLPTEAQHVETQISRILNTRLRWICPFSIVDRFNICPLATCTLLRNCPSMCRLPSRDDGEDDCMDDWCRFQHVELTCGDAMVGECHGLDYEVHQDDGDWSDRVALWGLREAHRRGVDGGNLLGDVGSRLFGRRCEEERGSQGIAF